MNNSLEQLLSLMQTLRDPEKGCPWDKAQTFATIAPFTLEEAYEVADAIERENFDELKSELGDLLFQVVFYCQMAQEQQRFNFYDVAQAMCDKLIARHPHVFADTQFVSVPELHKQWEARKAQERAQKAGDTAVSIVDDVPLALPALARAQKLQKRAASVGFDWQALAPVFEKLQEELLELQQAQQQADSNAIEDELGDVLFSCVNIARHLHVNSENALRRVNQKFERRFRCLEQLMAAEGQNIADANAETLEHYWQLAKKQLAQP